VNTMHQLTSTTTFEDQQWAASDIVAVIGNLIQVSTVSMHRLNVVL